VNEKNEENEKRGKKLTRKTFFSGKTHPSPSSSQAVPLRLNPRVSTLRSVYKAHIDVVHVQVEGGGASALLAGAGGAATAAAAAAAEVADGEGGEAAAAANAAAAAAAGPTTNVDGISESAEDASARVARLRALAASPDLYERLLASVAPSIWQLDDLKRGVLAQLFGGCSKTFSGGRARGEINVLLVGDPGVSKSQLVRESLVVLRERKREEEEARTTTSEEEEEQQKLTSLFSPSSKKKKNPPPT